MTRRRYRLSPIAPETLKRDFRKCHSFAQIAAERDVNVRYVYELLLNGVIPTNAAIAAKLDVDSTTRAQVARHGDGRLRPQRWWNHKVTPQQKAKGIRYLYAHPELIEIKKRRP